MTTWRMRWLVAAALLVLPAACVDLTPPSVLRGGESADAEAEPERPDAAARPDAGVPDAPARDAAAVDTTSDTRPDLASADAQPDQALMPDASPPDRTPPDGPLPVAAACATSAECRSGHCVDGVCCTTACGLTCHSCNLPGAVGTCSAVPAGQDPKNSCAEEAPATCGRDGFCDGAGGCRKHASGTPCSARTCTGTTETPANTCNGMGVCMVNAPRDCSPYVCGVDGCATTCSGAGTCKAGFSCSNGQCVPQALLLHWRFDEDSGTSALDSSPSALHGTYMGVTGAPSPSTSVPTLQFANPRSRGFNMTNRHYAELSPLPASLKPSRELTVSVWYRATKLDSLGAELLSAGDQYVVRLRSGNKLELSKKIAPAEMNAWLICEGTIANNIDGKWHHVAAVYGATAVKLYVDGVERCTRDDARDIVYDVALGTTLRVGRHGTDKPEFDFEGNIDDVRLYGRALSPQEVATLAAGGP